MKDSKTTKKDKRQTLIRLFKELLYHKWSVLCIVILVLISNALLIEAPTISGNIIDVVDEMLTKPAEEHALYYEQIFRMAITMGVLYLIAAITSYINAMLFSSVGQKVAYRLRQQAFNKLLRLSIPSLSKYQSGEVISRLTYDINVLTTSITNDFVNVITAFITIVGSLYVMIRLSPQLSLIYLIVVPCSLLFIRYKSKVIRPLFSERSRAIGRMCMYIDEKVTGVKTVRAYHAEEFFCDDFKEVNHKTSNAQRTAEFQASTTMPVTTFITNFALALIGLFGILLYIAGNTTLGTISNFTIHSRRFLGAISNCSNIISELQSALSAADRIFALLDEPEETDAPHWIEQEFEGEIEIEGLNFAYVPEIPILKDINFKVEPGQTVAIVGETGSGKTTFINLLMRFYDVDSGRILIDGVNLNEIPRKQIRQTFSLVLQSSWIFHDTVFQNIAYGNPTITMKQAIAAAKEARVHDIIMNMPQGYDTVLSENATNLSKGQKQLIAIARAMVQPSRMVILDEATSNVDTATEKRIHVAMQKLRAGKTSFVIAHRLSTIQDADKIIVIRQGNIAEMGTHDELLQRGGEYARIYHSQFI